MSVWMIFVSPLASQLASVEVSSFPAAVDEWMDQKAWLLWSESNKTCQDYAVKKIIFGVVFNWLKVIDYYLNFIPVAKSILFFA